MRQGDADRPMAPRRDGLGREEKKPGELALTRSGSARGLVLGGQLLGSHLGGRGDRHRHQDLAREHLQ